MNRVLVITGWGVASPVGIGAEDFAAAVRDRRGGVGDVRDLFDGQLPDRPAAALAAFRARDHLGRKGTGSLDRGTALALVAAGHALADAELVLDSDRAQATGVVLGTTAGSVQSVAEYDRDTLVQDKPYLVEPMLFPTTVMNCAAGRTAIRHGLKGVNATVAGGQLALVQVLRYTRNALTRGHAETVLAGAFEELSPHRAWQHRVAGTDGDAVGEGAGVFVVELPATAQDAGRVPRAAVLAVETAVGDDAGSALARCLARALEDAGVAPERVTLVATGERGEAGVDAAERTGIAAVLGDVPLLAVKDLVGGCDAAAGAFQLAALLARYRDGHRGVTVLTSVTAEGTAGVAVLSDVTSEGTAGVAVLTDDVTGWSDVD
ncbi:MULTISPECIES: beta-ketoacyl synthase N-terminal-like domain-containing protein [unclassified Saccharothrix]|uniref:beta-ketoacyl synthase N-terminal-like domain-containing protein n=1 Tax=unclassified Saccharothrix TaxID=2593673 RepID=UPI00307DE582